MTKAYESAIVGPIKDVYENLKDSDVKGEWVVVAYLESPEDPEEAG